MEKQRDGILDGFLVMADTGVSVGLTVTSHGQVISGELISPAEYASLLADAFETATHSGPEGGVVGVLRSAAEEAEGDRLERQTLRDEMRSGKKTEEEAGLEDQLRFLHLKDADVAGMRFPIWRCDLASIDGWAPWRPAKLAEELTDLSR